MLQPYPLLAITPVLGLTAYCLSHLLVSRMPRSGGPYDALLAGCGCGLAATVLLSAAALSLMRQDVADFLALLGMNIAEYLAFSFGYFNFINLNLASLRIRMLQELAEAGGEMPVEALTDLYNTDEVIALRIDRLVRGGHLIERQGHFYTGKRRFLIVGRVFDFLRWVVLGKRAPPSRCVPTTGRERIPQGVP